MDRREAAPEEEATSRRSGERGPQGLRCAGESQSLDGCFSDGCGDSRYLEWQLCPRTDHRRNWLGEILVSFQLLLPALAPRGERAWEGGGKRWGEKALPILLAAAGSWVPAACQC